MIPAKRPPRLLFVSFVYWVLLTYMVAALLWWFIALDKLNRDIADIRLNELKKDEPAYFEKSVGIIDAQKEKRRNTSAKALLFLH
jgi:two-component system sensor histidine kinase CiaH